MRVVVDPVGAVDEEVDERVLVWGEGDGWEVGGLGRGAHGGRVIADWAQQGGRGDGRSETSEAQATTQRGGEHSPGGVVVRSNAFVWAALSCCASQSIQSL